MTRILENSTAGVVMGRLIVAIAVLSAAPALAEPRLMSGEEIRELLPTIVAYGEDTEQVFYEGGTTNYVDNGRPSVGYWRTSDTQYCSKWPPFGGWVCYDVRLDEDAGELIWIGDSGTPLVNTYERQETAEAIPAE